MNAHQVDLLILGAGFAGLRAARAAARAGLEVLVLERKEVLGEPVRTSGASWIEAMQRLEIPAHLYHPVRVASLYSANATARIDLPEPVGCILHVAELVQHLADQAREAGAEVRAGVRARKPLVEGGRVVGVETSQGPIRARRTVDATGVAAFLSRHLGEGGFERYGLGAELTLRAPRWDPEHIAFWVGPPVAPSGYAWAFPEGNELLRLGMGVIRPDVTTSPHQLLEALRTSDHPEAALWKDAEVVETRTGAIPSQPAPMGLVGPGWLQVGDCAGMASPLLGEGIRFCLEMGEVAGQACARAHQQPAHADQALADYAGEWRRRHGRKFALEHRLNRRLARLDAEGWDRAVQLLGALPGRAPLDVLAGRWSSPRLLATMALRRPRLALELAWGMLRGSR